MIRGGALSRCWPDKRDISVTTVPPSAPVGNLPTGCRPSARCPPARNVGFVGFLRGERSDLRSIITDAGDALCPAYYPVSVLPVAAPEPIPRQQRPHLPHAVWSQIAGRAPSASLRDLAAKYGVSHETSRAIVRRVAAQRREDLIA